MHFHTDEPRTIAWLAAVMTKASNEGNRVRIDTDYRGDLRVKVGEGIWSAPVASTADATRSPGESPADRAAREVAEGRIRSMKATT